MNLTTRCPNCGTAFRVAPAQLSARGGKVRCGKCGHVFDGVNSLVAEGPATAGNEPPKESEPSPQLGLFEAAKKLPAMPGAGAAANEDAAAPRFLDDMPPPKRRLAWVLAVSFACAALLAQTYVFRNDIAAAFPKIYPVLAAACAEFKCELNLLRQPKLMAIESSDLQADSQRENVIVLNAVLRNQAPFAQKYPSLELTLTDERDEAVARRVLAPADYLGGAAANLVARGIGPGADAVLRVYIDTSGLRAVGYRMYLFFP